MEGQKLKTKNRNIHQTEHTLLQHGSTETNISVQDTVDVYLLLDYTLLFMFKDSETFYPVL